LSLKKRKNEKDTQRGNPREMLFCLMIPWWAIEESSHLIVVRQAQLRSFYLGLRYRAN